MGDVSCSTHKCTHGCALVPPRTRLPHTQHALMLYSLPSGQASSPCSSHIRLENPAARYKYDLKDFIARWQSVALYQDSPCSSFQSFFYHLLFTFYPVTPPAQHPHRPKPSHPRPTCNQARRPSTQNVSSPLYSPPLAPRIQCNRSVPPMGAPGTLFARRCRT